ncbi:MAG: aspartate aminotransferase family protein [Acidimicrobiia bacterium]
MRPGADYNFVPGQPTPQVVATEGAELVLSDGRRILDAGGGAIVLNIGHGRPEIAEVAARSLAVVDYVIPPWSTPDRQGLVDRLVRSWLPAGIDRVALMSGGSESVDSALRLAHSYHVCNGEPDRWKVIGRWPSYHGVTIGGLSVGGHRARRAGMDRLLLDFPHVAWDDADAVEAMIEAQGPETVAAFIAEPVIGAAGGALVPPADYFPRVAEICRRYGVLFIADEVMTGFGRTGRKFGIDHWDVVPDILVGGKGLSGGYAPMGGVYAKSSVTQTLADKGQGFMFFTYASHSSACAISDRVLEIMEQEQLVERCATVGAKLIARLREVFAEHPHVSEVRGLGLMIGLELVAERSPQRWFPAGAQFAAAVVREALDRGVWVYPAGSGDPVQDAVMLGPPFTITDAEMDRLVEVLHAAVDAAAASISASA